MKEISELIILIVFFIVFCLAIFKISNYQCHKTAEMLGYSCQWHPMIGCVLEKPNGQKILLKYLRHIEN